MSVVVLSLDTASKQLVLTINGVLVPFVDCNMSKMTWDGEEHIEFSYTTEGVSVDGLKERRRFFLPTLEDLAAEANMKINEDGFASRAVFDDEKAKADTIDFLNQVSFRRRSKQSAGEK